MARCIALLLLALPLAFGCATARSPELRVLGIQEARRHEVLFVQVTNPADRPMRLTKLEYRFAAGSATVSEGELALAREVPAGEAIVVEVPLEVPGTAAPREPLTLRGKLTAVTDQIVRIFDVSASVGPSAAPSAAPSEPEADATP